jgi:hypothetical protein
MRLNCVIAVRKRDVVKGSRKLTHRSVKAAIDFYSVSVDERKGALLETHVIQKMYQGCRML